MQKIAEYFDSTKNNHKLSFSIQNCNSLNLTGLSTNFATKVTAIASCKSDIIFISDIRLLGCNGIKNDERVSNAFRDCKEKSYSSILHSSKNSRGIGILYSNELNFEVNEMVKDADENFLAMRAKIESFDLILVSVYGPNGSDAAFFRYLDGAINQLSRGESLPIIMGGDWNTTWDSSPIQTNIDTIQMSAVPNLQNSILLHRLCEKLKLTDPYRIVNPTKR
jgi:exonuclease III